MKDETMRPMEAWRIIRRILCVESKGFSDDEITAMIMAFEALRRMEEDT